MVVNETKFRIIMKQKAKIVLYQRLFSNMLASLFYLLPLSLLYFLIQELLKETDALKLILFSAVSLMVGLLLMAPLIMGKYRFFGMQMRDANPKISEMFLYFGMGSLYWQSVALTHKILWRLLAWGSLYSLPAIGYYVFLFQNQTVASATQQNIFSLFVIWAIVMIEVKHRTYAGAWALTAMNPLMPSKAALITSKKLFKGRFLMLFYFYLSFIPWMILSVFTAGISGIFYDAYYNLSYIAIVDSLLVQNLKELKDLPKEEAEESLKEE